MWKKLARFARTARTVIAKVGRYIVEGMEKSGGYPEGPWM